MLQLASQRVPVAALDNLDTKCGGNPQIAHIDCDVTSYDVLERAICEGGFSHVIHLAAYGRNLTCRDFPSWAYTVNVHGTRNLLMIADKHRDIVKRVVVCSSNIVLSAEATVYKFTKQAAEHEIEWFAAKGVSCMGLRPSNIYGANQSKTEYQLCAFAGLDESYRKNGYFEISGDGTQTRDWVHAEDVARAFELAALSKVPGGTLDVCTGVQTSMNDVAKMLKVPVKYTEARPGDAKTLVSNRALAGTQLGFWAEIKLQDRIRDAFPSLNAVSA